MGWLGDLWRRLFPRPAAPAAPVPVPLPTRCPGCGAPVLAPPKIACPRCGAEHHRNCWLLVARCSSATCPSRDAPRPPVEILEVTEKKPEPASPELPSVGLCQVCGTEMKTDVVTCRKCRTPHHRSCWNYMGHCTTYGCKEKNATQIRERSAGDDEIVFIDERPQQEKNSVRVWMDQIAERYRGGPVQRETPKRGRYNLKFNRAGIRCALEGRRGSHAWRIRFRAKLTPEQMARVPADARVTREEGEHGMLTLRPVDDLNRFERMQGFFDACLRIVDAAVRSREGRPA